MSITFEPPFFSSEVNQLVSTAGTPRFPSLRTDSITDNGGLLSIESVTFDTGTINANELIFTTSATSVSGMISVGGLITSTSGQLRGKRIIGDGKWWKIYELNNSTNDYIVTRVIGKDQDYNVAFDLRFIGSID